MILQRIAPLFCNHWYLSFYLTIYYWFEAQQALIRWGRKMHLDFLGCLRIFLIHEKHPLLLLIFFSFSFFSSSFSFFIIFSSFSSIFTSFITQKKTKSKFYNFNKVVVLVDWFNQFNQYKYPRIYETYKRF